MACSPRNNTGVWERNYVRYIHNKMTFDVSLPDLGSCCDQNVTFIKIELPDLCPWLTSNEISCRGNGNISFRENNTKIQFSTFAYWVLWFFSEFRKSVSQCFKSEAMKDKNIFHDNLCKLNLTLRPIPICIRRCQMYCHSWILTIPTWTNMNIKILMVLLQFTIFLTKVFIWVRHRTLKAVLS